jgi:hypothetical protein
MGFLGCLVAILALAAAAQLASVPRADLAYLLYAAASVIDGARLYVDVVEINPPLIVVLNMPAVLLARALEVSEILVYRALVIVALLGALAFAGWCLRRLLGPSGATLRRLLMLVLAFALFLAAGDDFGQREHLLTALTLPYLLLAASRASGKAAPTGAALAAGALAGIGLALKPQFLLLWGAVEAYVAWHSRARRLSPDAIAVASFLAVYVAAVVLLTPEYFELVRLLGPTYAEYGRYPLLHVLVTAPGTALCALSVLVWAALRREARYPTLWTVLLLALVAGFLAGAAQQKGWGYHFYPSRVFAVALLALAVTDVRRPLLRPVQRVYTAVAFAALGTILLSAITAAVARVTLGDPAQRAEETRLAELVAAVRRHAPPGGSLYVLSYSNEAGFPLVNYSGARWASRFPHLWILEAVYHDALRASSPLRFHAPEKVGAAERYLNDAVYEDLTRNRPDLLMVLRHARDAPQNTHRRLDYLAYFSRQPRIDSVLRQYRFAGTVGEYLMYVRAGSPDEPGAPPTSEPGRHDLVRSEVTAARALVTDPEFLFEVLIFIVLAAAGLIRAHRDAAARAPQAPARR